MLILTQMKKDVKPPFTVPSWSGGTDAEIVNALIKHYRGEIDLTEYWSVGEERTVTLNAMDGNWVEDPYQTYGNAESHVQQQVKFVISNVGGKLLEDGVTECAFQVDQKNCLLEKGYMNPTESNTGGWDESARRIWCNEVYYYAIPESFRKIFRRFMVITAENKYDTTTAKTSIDYFALRAEKEVFGSNTYANATAESALSVAELYDDNSVDRYKRINGTTVSWCLRSPNKDSDNYFTNVGSNNHLNPQSGSDANWPMGLAPFGVI